MAKIEFSISKYTKVYRHQKGDPFNIHRNFSIQATDRDVTFSLDDVWFLPPDIAEWLKQSPDQINRDTPEGWPKELERAIGFKLPDNKLNVDYIVVPFGLVQWRRVPETTTDKPDSAEKVMRKIHGQSKDFYFPGKLPS